MGHSDGVIVRIPSAIRKLRLLSFPNLTGHSCIRGQWRTCYIQYKLFHTYWEACYYHRWLSTEGTPLFTWPLM